VTRQGYGLMPIGQVGFAMLAGPVLGLVAGVLVARQRRG
jgi:hypothetical protein